MEAGAKTGPVGPVLFDASCDASLVVKILAVIIRIDPLRAQRRRQAIVGDRGGGAAWGRHQTRTTSGFKDQRMPSTSLRVGASTWQVSSAAIASSSTAMNSCSLMFMPRCVASMSLPL